MYILAITIAYLQNGPGLHQRSGCIGVLTRKLRKPDEGGISEWLTAFITCLVITGLESRLFLSSATMSKELPQNSLETHPPQVLLPLAGDHWSNYKRSSGIFSQRNNDWRNPCFAKSPSHICVELRRRHVQNATVDSPCFQYSK